MGWGVRWGGGGVRRGWGVRWGDGVREGKRRGLGVRWGWIRGEGGGYGYVGGCTLGGWYVVRLT